MNFELSKYQKQILNEFQNSNDNLFISALAGASKTFMLTEISKLIKNYSVFIAFNKVIQLELSEKIKNPKFRTYTFNGLGYQILLKNAEEQGISNVIIDKYKSNNICRKIASQNILGYKQLDSDLKQNLVNDLTTLYELCRAYMIEFNNIKRINMIVDNNNLFMGEEMEVPDNLDRLLTLIDEMNMYQFEHEGIISFSDQLYITVKKLQTKEWKVPGYLKFYHILVDECQDTSILQQQLIYYIRRENARVVIVGDKFQSIYYFNGADQYSIDHLKKTYNMKELKLPICYRCPSSHLNYVNKKFPYIGIEPAPNAKVGKVKRILLGEIKDYVKEGDFILSRKNKDLCEVVLDILDMGIPIYFKDVQFVEKIIKKIEGLKRKTRNVYELKDYIIEDRDKCKNKLKNAVETFLNEETENDKSSHDDIEKYTFCNEVVDLFDCIIVLLRNYLSKNDNGSCTIGKFIDYVKKMLNTTSRKNAVVCSSIHQAKGSETNNVFVLNEAEPMIYNYMSPEQKQQEINLSYVSLTRAKENLYLVEMPKKEDEEFRADFNGGALVIKKANQIIDEFYSDYEQEDFDIELEDMLP